MNHFLVTAKVQISAVWIVFFLFRIESNSWALIEILNWIEYLSLVSKVTSSKYLLNNFNCFYGTALWFLL